VATQRSIQPVTGIFEVSDERSEPGGREVVESLISVAFAVNKALQRYIVVHDAVFKFSLRKILPLPFFFKPIDYGALWRETESVLADLAAAQSEVETLATSHVAPGGEAEQLSACLREYIAALQRTVEMLATLCQRLFKKSQGEPLSWCEYNDLCDTYTATIPVYTQVGARLSALLRKVEPGFFTEQTMGQINMRQYDPKLNLSFCELISEILLHYRTLEVPDDIVALLGRSRLTDITDLPQSQMVDALIPPPEGFTQRTYQFKESGSRRGVFDFAFHEGRLVNFRGQLFFLGWLGSMRAAVFYSTRLRAFMHRIIGTEFHYEARLHGFVTNAGNGLLVAFCRPRGEPYVSVYITDEAYA